MSDGSNIVNTSIMATLLEKLSKLPFCGEILQFNVLRNRKRGLAQFFSAKYISCDWADCFCATNTVESEARGTKGL